MTPARGGAVAHLDGIRVLVVDDCASVREAVATVLQEFGAEVMSAGAADRAFDMLRRDRPDVVISDLEMPGKGGYWLIGRIRTLAPELGGATPAIALPGLSGPQHRASALHAGFQRQVAKPVDLESLTAIVASLAQGESHPDQASPAGEDPRVPAGGAEAGRRANASA